jgi:hypothetical protein
VEWIWIGGGLFFVGGTGGILAGKRRVVGTGGRARAGGPQRVQVWLHVAQKEFHVFPHRLLLVGVSEQEGRVEGRHDLYTAIFLIFTAQGGYGNLGPEERLARKFSQGADHLWLYYLYLPFQIFPKAIPCKYSLNLAAIPDDY